MPEVVMPPEAKAMPDPGDVLMKRVSGNTDRAWFYSSGQQSVRELERTLTIVGRPLDTFDSILDFGTGCGRMILWMGELGRKRALHGTDIDAEAVAWDTEHIPFATFSVNGADPPLPYKDASFDLVFNHSVFTHIDRARQDAWLAELHRVTRHGALVLLSVHGERAIPEDTPGVKMRVETEGIVFVDQVHPKELGFPDWYQATFHAPWYVFEHWGKWFDVRAYVPGAALSLQDHVLLERRATDDLRTPLAARPRRPSAIAVPPVTDTPTRYGAAGDFARRSAMRLLAPYFARQEKVNMKITGAIDELTRASREHAARLDALESDPLLGKSTRR